jgi:hypothetical protein
MIRIDSAMIRLEELEKTTASFIPFSSKAHDFLQTLCTSNPQVAILHLLSNPR